MRKKTLLILLLLYTASLITTKHVIPAKAGIQENTGFRVKPGMTNWLRFMSLCIAWVCLISCAVTLKNYKPVNPEEAAIISTLIVFEEGFNKEDQKKILSIVADEAQIMIGRAGKLVNKEEYAKILPERFKAIGAISISNPKIKIDRDTATVKAHYESRVVGMPYSFNLKKIGGKWLILSNSY